MKNLLLSFPICSSIQISIDKKKIKQINYRINKKINSNENYIDIYIFMHILHFKSKWQDLKAMFIQQLK